METELLEIVELSNGEIVLRRAASTAAPLLTMAFSAESEQLLANVKMAVVSVMIEAGMQAYAELTQPEKQAESAVLH